MMKKTLITLVASLLLPLAATHAVEVENLRCEYLKDPLGVDVAKPPHIHIFRRPQIIGGELGVRMYLPMDSSATAGVESPMVRLVVFIRKGVLIRC